MRQLGMQGIVRGRPVRTTIPSKDGKRAGDLLNRNFHTYAPNKVWVTDFVRREALSYPAAVKGRRLAPIAVGA